MVGRRGRITRRGSLVAMAGAALCAACHGEPLTTSAGGSGTEGADSATDGGSASAEAGTDTGKDEDTDTGKDEDTGKDDWGTDTGKEDWGTDTGKDEGGDGDGDGDGDCAPVSGDYGECEAIIGVAFDGTTCKTFSGCGCEPDCDHFFPDDVSCAHRCAGEGYCRDEIVTYPYLGGGAWIPIQGCDLLNVCLPPTWVYVFEALTGMTCQTPSDTTCAAGTTACALGGAWPLGDELHDQSCAATLLDGTVSVECLIYGP